MADTIKVKMSKKWAKISDDDCTVQANSNEQFQFAIGATKPEPTSDAGLFLRISEPVALDYKTAVWCRLPDSYMRDDKIAISIVKYGLGESSPRLSADFTAGTYMVSGVDQEFADLFTFNRAGKAWLVKDTGLQEYAADAPRLDNGLLIEQSATNAMLMSALNDNSNYSYTQQADGSVKITCIKATTNATDARLNNLSSYYPLGSSANHVVRGVHFKEVSKNVHLGGASETSSASAGVDGFIGLELSNGWSNLTHNWLKMARTDTATSVQRQVQVFTGGKLTGSDVATSVGDYIVIDCVYASSDNPLDRYATPIKAINTPVTRPADFLLNKITGTAVTGDWDSTLTLSIVAGKLVHSGYGRIRSLEIN